MSLRICPNCHKELGNYDHYFCTSCGAVLPKEFANERVQVKIKDFDPYSSTKLDNFSMNFNLGFLKGFFHPKAFIAIILIVVLGIGAFYVDRLIPSLKFLTKSQVPEIVLESSQSVVITQTLDLPLSGESSFFVNQVLNEFVPAEAELYLFSNNLGQFLSSVSEIEIYDELFSSFPTALEKPFVMYTVDIQGSKDWAVIIPQNEDPIVNKILDAALNDFAIYTFVEDYLIIASNEEVIQMTLAAKSRVALNLPLNPKYVQVQSKLPKEGQAVVMFLTPDGKKSFEDAKNYKIGNTLKNTIDAVLKTGYNELVII